MKRNLLFLTLALLLVLTACGVRSGGNPYEGELLICLDAGHGGTDSGAVLEQRLEKREGFLAQSVDRRRLEALLEGEGGTWFGQLMARPQLIAWLVQLDAWFEAYGVEVRA